MEIRIECGEEAVSVGRKVEQELLAALSAENVQSTNAAIIISARDDNHRLMGGVTGSTSYGWLHVKTLWVHQKGRGEGVGRQLMQAIEAKAVDLGCHGAWLDTSSASAKEFYAKLGFQIFGDLANGDKQDPSGHCRWFLKRYF